MFFERHIDMVTKSRSFVSCCNYATGRNLSLQEQYRLPIVLHKVRAIGATTCSLFDSLAKALLLRARTSFRGAGISTTVVGTFPSRKLDKEKSFDSPARCGSQNFQET